MARVAKKKNKIQRLYVQTVTDMLIFYVHCNICKVRKKKTDKQRARDRDRGRETYHNTRHFINDVFHSILELGGDNLGL